MTMDLPDPSDQLREARRRLALAQEQHTAYHVALADLEESIAGLDPDEFAALASHDRDGLLDDIAEDFEAPSD
jgi:hypothetical protein